MRLVELADRLPGTPDPLPARPGAALALFASALVASGLARAFRPRGAPPWNRVAAAVFAALWMPWRAAPARLELALLDVGHGTALAARGPGLGTLVFDAGSRDRRGIARRALGPWLARAEATNPTVVLSHADRDHASALDWLVERYPPRAWLGALPAPLNERLPHRCERLDLDPTGALTRNRGPFELRLARGLGEAGNEGSRALVLDFPGGRAVLLGDAEGEGLAHLLELGLGDPRTGPTDLLLAPHHGSETHLLGPLIEQVRPSLVWISASAPPPIGPELDRRSIPWAVTRRDGPRELRLGPPPWHEVRTSAPP